MCDLTPVPRCYCLCHVDYEQPFRIESTIVDGLVIETVLPLVYSGVYLTDRIEAALACPTCATIHFPCFAPHAPDDTPEDPALAERRRLEERWGPMYWHYDPNSPTNSNEDPTA